MLLANDDLYLISYYDQAIAREPIDKVKKKPFVLWACGKIINFHDQKDPYYFLVTAGRLFRKLPPQEYQMIFKKTIIKMKKIYSITEEDLMIN